MEKIVESKNCKHCEVTFNITDKDLEFYEKVSPVFNFTKYSIPTPTLCPDCRQKRRISFRNFWNLYKNKCLAVGKDIISMYNDVDFPVYSNDYWWGDSWDAIDYGIDFDFNKSFFKQYKSFSDTVPRFATMNIACEDSKYSNFAMNSNSCYLVFGCVRNEDCLYGHIVWDSKNCLDNLYSYRCENTSNCVDCVDSNNLHFSQESISCSNSFFLYNCNSCTDCFGCVNLVNKSYCLFNKQLTKQDYLEKISKLNLNHLNISENINIVKNLKSNINVFPKMFGFSNENCSGDHIYESKNCVGFDVKDGEDSRYIYNSHGQIKSYDISFTGTTTTYCYDSLTLGNVERGFFSQCCFDCTDIFYSEFCYNSSYLFGCNGLRDKSYCIFNKQYTKEEYNTIVPKIMKHMKTTGEWGEFFPSSISPFCYNETVAQEYFPLSEKEALNLGLSWSTYEAPLPKVDKIIPASKLPDNIEDIPDDILNWAIKCEVTDKPFRIIKPELEFYRKHNLPIPKRHPDQRHLDRINLRNPRKLFYRECDKCNINMNTTYSPDREERVYCEECYNREIY